MATKTNYRRLPQELIDAIVHEFDDGSPCLIACSQTAKTFRVPCQRIIFRAVVLHGEETHGFFNTCRRACDLLAASPLLAVYVCHLSIPLPTVEKETRYLKGVLGALHNVERFMISNPGESVNWNPNLDSAIFRIVSLPSLDRLHLINVSYLPSSLVYLTASATRVLSLNGVYIQKTLVGAPAPSLLQLEHLIISSSRASRGMTPIWDLIRKLRKEGYLQHLRRVSLKLETDEDYLQIFAPLTDIIQHLEMDCSRHFSLIKIPRFELLRILELAFYIGMFRDLPSSLSLVVLDFPSSAPLLERLTLTLGIMPRIPEIPWSLDPPYPVFDTGFMERRDLPRLHNVTWSSTHLCHFVTSLRNEKVRNLDGCTKVRHSDEDLGKLVT
ncbi:hypothetical protein B0H17DRAFT_1287390 [Mycena rosella]|uniref:Uncharacterized protein n=1 Tax=Mycena rosella TaxID=1033263 RepID=A0AAD7M9G0_MYCRO|nr:hypothetical protein B0H17DRAFT_1287390 [Mycena rosella]